MYDDVKKPIREKIAGINHMAWLLEIEDADGNDLYPEIKERSAKRMEKPGFWDKVRFDYIKRFGYYCTESSEHNAEYNMFYIKSKYPELIERYNIPLECSGNRSECNGCQYDYLPLSQQQ